MEIRIKQTGAVVTEGEFRAMFPNTGFPVPLTEKVINDFGGDVVFEGPQAVTTTPYQISVRQGVEQVNGKWFTKYVVGPVFADAQQEADYKARKDAEQATNIRKERENLLKECDWTQGKDIPDAISQPWAPYRQALRDVPAQAGFPWNVSWPEKP